MDDRPALAPEFCNRPDARSTKRRDGVSIRVLVRGPWLEVIEYTVPRGFIAGAADFQEFEKAGYVVSGRLAVSTTTGDAVVEAGGAYSLPRGLPHRFTVLEDAVIVQTRAPVEDGTAAVWSHGR